MYKRHEPIEIQSAALKNIIKNINKGLLAISKKKTHPINNIKSAIILDPIVINFLRPVRSRNMTMIVKITWATQTN